MEKSEYFRLMKLALNLDTAAYRTGYRRGLLRAYHGTKFGTEKDHKVYLKRATSPYENHRIMGLAYRDALAGKEPQST